MNDINISHCKSIVTLLEEEFGKGSLTVTRGDVHEYLGMTIDFSQPSKVQFTMNEYVKGLVKGLVDECSEDWRKGTATTPAANHLFQVNLIAEKLSPSDTKVYHHLTAKLLYLAKHTHPDLQTAIAFLTTIVKSPDIDDYKKLGQCI